MNKFNQLLLLVALSSHAAAESILIKNADIYTGKTVLPSTDLLIVDGRIAAIGNSSQKTDRVIDGSGKSISPGLFNADTHLGSVEVSAIAPTVDFYTDNPNVTASLKVADAFNPNSTLLPHNRTHGLTHALSVPEANTGLFAGQVSLIELGNQPRVIHDSVAVAMDFTEHGVSLAGNSRAAAMAVLRQNLADTIDFAANKRAAMAGERRDYSLSLADLEALEPVVSGAKPLIVSTHRASDISAMLALANDYGLTLIFRGATEGWMVADAIAAAKVPVIMDPIYNLPVSYESLGARLDNAKLLADAGVTLVFTGMGSSTHNAHLVRQSAGNAVANGLDKLAAIAAMTVTPAQLFNANVSGEIKLGAVADLVMWGGDPLEMTSEAELVIIDGDVVPMASRSLQLRDRYFKATP